MPAEFDDDQESLGLPVDRFDMEIVEFMLSWAPYGGPPEDECVPRFGMSRDRLVTRLRDIVRNGRRGHLDVNGRALLKRADALPIEGQDDAPQPRADRRPPLVGQPVLRRGVWRWP